MNGNEPEGAGEFHRNLLLRQRDVEEQRDRLDTELANIVRAIESIEALIPALRSRYSSPTQGGTPLRGKGAVLEVLRLAEGKWLSIKDIVIELRMRGWLGGDVRDPDAAVRVSLRRLNDDGAPIQKGGQGRTIEYCFFSSDAPTEVGASEQVPNQGGLMDPP
ncbi:MAG: hypothetical protein WD651_09495 [Acidimicrobiia bacterium]